MSGSTAMPASKQHERDHRPERRRRKAMRRVSCAARYDLKSPCLWPAQQEGDNVQASDG